MAWHVDVLEAQGKLGGRVLSHRFKEAPNLVCELGGEWIGADHRAMKRLCSTFKLPLEDHRYSFSFWNVKNRSRTYYPGEWCFSRRSKRNFDKFACEVKKYSDAKLRRLDEIDWWTQLRLLGFTEDELLKRDLMDSTDFGESIKLPWTFVDEKAGFIRLPASYVKEKKKRNVPISPELQTVLDEVKAEQKKVSSISGRVFTRNGRPMKSIQTAFEEASEKAGIEDLHLHDFRHTCITRWAAMGIPQPAIMAAAGHHSIQQNQDYTNMKGAHLKQAFRNSTPVIQDTGLETKRNVSY